MLKGIITSHEVNCFIFKRQRFVSSAVWQENHGFTLILENDDVVEFHDFNGGQVLRGLGLGACFVSGDQEESSILEKRC
jgi:hypothetical protein